MSEHPLSPWARSLLESEKTSPPLPAPEAASRVLSRLESTMAALPAAAPSSASTAAASTASTIKLSTGLLMMAVGAAAGSLTTVAVLRKEVPPPVIIEQPAPVMPATKIDVVPPVEPASDAGPPPALPSPKPPAKKTMVVVEKLGVESSQLHDEQLLLDMARAAIVSGRSSAALEALARHEQNFPKGEMAEEREALAVQALTQTGDVKAAAARAEKFRKRFPGSIFLPVVDAASPPVTEKIGQPNTGD